MRTPVTGVAAAPLVMPLPLLLRLVLLLYVSYANSAEQQLTPEGPPPGEASPGLPSTPHYRGASAAASPVGGAGAPVPNSSTLLKALGERCPWFDINGQ